MSNIPYIVGLSGGIGSGKSEASAILHELGVFIIDADVVAHELSQKGQAGYEALKREFGEFFDESGNLMRKELRAHIFSNNYEDRLNAIMMPIIISEIESRIIDSDAPLICLVAPLLFESGMHKICNLVISIIAEREKRIDRLMERDNMDRALAERMIDSQISDSERKRLSDIIIYNDKDVSYLRRKVEFYYDKIKKNIQEDT